MPNTLSKKQRLTGELTIQTLFRQGKIIIAYPIRICYLSTYDDCNRILVSVSKRLFKRAVKRNLLKRRMREAYRLNQNHLREITETGNTHLQIAFLYMSAEVCTFEQIEKAMVKAFSKIKL